MEPIQGLISVANHLRAASRGFNAAAKQTREAVAAPPVNLTVAEQTFQAGLDEALKGYRIFKSEVAPFQSTSFEHGFTELFRNASLAFVDGPRSYPQHGERMAYAAREVAAEAWRRAAMQS